MPSYALPLESGTESDSSPETISRISTNSFQSVIDQGDISTEMSTQNNGLPSEGSLSINNVYQMLEEMRARDELQKQEINTLRQDVKDLASLIKAQSEDEVKIPQIPNTFPTTKIVSDTQPPQKLKQLKWPPPYDHKDPAEWPTTYGILCHIYQRDVVERNLLQPSDFFMDLYNVAVTGTAKSIVSGPFQSMMVNGQISDAMGFLKIMDDSFRDLNADQNASVCLNALFCQLLRIDTRSMNWKGR